jgi:hypothetical protein
MKKVDGASNLYYLIFDLGLDSAALFGCFQFSLS